METPLSPVEIMRRARRLYAGREAVVDGDVRFTYAQFFDRCDRWSSVLQQKLGVAKGDRVATIAPNMHAQLEAFYAVPQLGAVLVPVNYRLIADDFAYILAHSGSTVVCVHPDYVDLVDSVRDRIPGVKHFVLFEGGPREGWLDYEALVAAAEPAFERPVIDGAAEGGHDLPPQRVHEQRGHSRAHAHDSGRAVPLDPADVPRERLDLRVDRHRRRRDPRLPPPGRAAAHLCRDRARVGHDALGGPDRAHRHRERE
jgi:hypothetical protein